MFVGIRKLVAGVAGAGHGAMCLCKIIINGGLRCHCNVELVHVRIGSTFSLNPDKYG